MATVTNIAKDKGYLTKSAARRSITRMKRSAHRAARRATRVDLQKGNWDTHPAPRMTGWDVV